MNRRSLLLASLVVTGRGASAQGESPQFRPIEYEDIAIDARIADVARELKGKDQVFVPPLFRYRLSLRTSGSLQPIHPRRREALDRWGTSNRAPDFVARFNNEVEVSSAKSSFRLLWQDVLIAPYKDELSSGGSLTVNVLLAGAIEHELLLLAIGFQTL